MRIYIGQDDQECLGHMTQVVSDDQVTNYADLIDPEYVVTEVVYYFEQERDEQYLQDFLAINLNDPFY